MAAAQQTYDKVKPFKQPHHKPFFDAECREALRQYKEAKRDPSSHAAKVFLKQFKATVRRKKAIHKTSSSLTSRSCQEQPSTLLEKIQATRQDHSKC